MIVKIGRKLIESKSDKDFFSGGNVWWYIMEIQMGLMV